MGDFHSSSWLSNSPTINIGVHIKISVFDFSRYILRSGIAGSYISCIFSFLRNLHTISVCTNLHSHQQHTSALFSPHHHQHLLFVVVLMIAILRSVRLYHTLVVLMCIYLLLMLSICSCACWPFVCLLWTMFIQIFCQLFNYFLKNIELCRLFMYFGY